MNYIATRYACLALTLLPALAHAAGYKFKSIQYPEAATILTGIDDANRLIGYINNTAGPQAFLMTTAGTVATITPPGAVFELPTAINRSYGVVGNAYDGSNSFMFQDNVIGYGALSGLLLAQDVTGLNSSFDIVGNYMNPELNNSVYARINGTYHELLPSRCAYTHDPAINDDGVVVGNCVNNQDASLVFTWSKGKYTFITPPSNMVYVQATGINKSGVVAGWYNDANGFEHGFVLNGGVFTTVDYPGASNTQIMGINKAGTLAGTYQGFMSTGFTATPQ